MNLRAGHADLSERTYRALRDLILTRALSPGAKVTAEGLSQQFGVSRTTVKSALDQLAGEGLVVVRPQVGTFVRGLTEQDVREIWDVRALIESHAARSGAILATEAQRAALRSIVRQMTPHVDQQEYRADTYPDFIDLDRRFHELVVETAHNGFLLGLHRQTAAHIHVVSYTNLRAKRGLRRAGNGLREHGEIVDAFERRDPDAAAAAVIHHIERSREVALQALAHMGDVI